jgi:DNA-binding NarL/FixJ family response regulator
MVGPCRILLIDDDPAFRALVRVMFGARRILHKPFSRDELLAAVADVLAGESTKAK